MSWAIAQMLGDRELARRHFDVVVRLDATYAGARRRLAEVLLAERDRGDLDRAAVLLRSLPGPARGQEPRDR